MKLQIKLAFSVLFDWHRCHARHICHHAICYCRNVLFHETERERRACTSKSSIQTFGTLLLHTAHRVDGVAVVSFTAYDDVYLIVTRRSWWCAAQESDLRAFRRKIAEHVQMCNHGFCLLLVLTLRLLMMRIVQVATFFFSFVGMLVLSLIHFEGMANTADGAVPSATNSSGSGSGSSLRYTQVDWVMLISSQAATAVLVFNAITSPLAQPRNVIFGNMISAFWGVAIGKSIPPQHTWLAAPLAVSVAMLFMDLTRTLHPPRRRHCIGFCDWISKSESARLDVRCAAGTIYSTIQPSLPWGKRRRKEKKEKKRDALFFLNLRSTCKPSEVVCIFQCHIRSAGKVSPRNCSFLADVLMLTLRAGTSLCRWRRPRRYLLP